MSNRRTAKSDASSAQGSLAFDACGPSVDAAAEARRRESALPRHEVRAAKRVLSYGGGLDSFGMLVDAVARGDKPDLVVFADVTDPERKDPGEKARPAGARSRVGAHLARAGDLPQARPGVGRRRLGAVRRCCDERHLP